MPQLTIQRRTITAAGHHRQPRSAAAATPPEDVEIIGQVYPGSSISRDPEAVAGERYLFWSVTDQSTVSFTQTAAHLSTPMPSNDTVVTAWYLPLGGNGRPGPDGYIIDAFSELAGDLIDDDFVDVAPDTTLTADANVVGWVPTAGQEILTARPFVRGVMPFDQWIGDGHVAGEKDTLDQATSGYALATYAAPPKIMLPQRQFEAYQRILWGIINDVKGGVLTPGGPEPVDPGWGALLQASATAAMVESLTANTKHAAEISRLVMHEVNVAIERLNQARDTVAG